MMKPFRLKQFTVEQDRTAMKIGTDAILLGAWASLDHQPFSVLDIGTGTGIIALMLAQRSHAQLIDALEIDEDAYEQAVENFENSDWGDRLFCYHAALDEFVEEMREEAIEEEEKYELIISNPPFYSDDYPSGKAQRDKARFAEALPFDELLYAVSVLLAKKGKFSVILPYKEEKSFLSLAENQGLLLQRVTRVRGNKKTQIIRSMLEFGFQETPLITDELIIENARHDYTPEYINLVKDFYLNM